MLNLILLNASNFVEDVDAAFMVITGISLFFLVGLTALMIYFIIVYRKSKNPKATQIKGNTKLEIIWITIPLLLVMLMFYYGWRGWKNMYNIPDEGIKVKVISRMWSWTFEYENGQITDTLVVPKDTNVILDLISADVIHSLFIPDFRVKMDINPYQSQKMWFRPYIEGDFSLFCAEYCGLSHAEMITEVKVITKKEFTKWYEKPETLPTNNSGKVDRKQLGLKHLKRNGCIACHTLDGTKIIGPSFKGRMGTKITVLENDEEKEIMMDLNYLRTSIYEPNKQIVKGYPKGQMTSYKDFLNEEQIEDIFEYIQSLNEKE